MEAGILPKRTQALPQEEDWIDNMINFTDYPKN